MSSILRRTGAGRRVVSAALVGLTLSLTAATGHAAPVLNNTAMVAATAPGATIDVRWRRGWAAAGVGFAAGALLGAAVANANRGYYYGGPQPYYGETYYAPAPVYVEPAPVYVQPAPVYAAPVYAAPYADPNGPARRCYVSNDPSRGYGAWVPC